LEKYNVFFPKKGFGGGISSSHQKKNTTRRKKEHAKKSKKEIKGGRKGVGSKKFQKKRAHTGGTGVPCGKITPPPKITKKTKGVSFGQQKGKGLASGD